MLDDESIYCVDALKQLKAVQGALARVGALVLKSHLKDHVVTAAQRGDADEIAQGYVDNNVYQTPDADGLAIDPGGGIDYPETHRRYAFTKTIEFKNRYILPPP